eukprot:2909842-Alexandrium_andersonii.AAC.1
MGRWACPPTRLPCRMTTTRTAQGCGASWATRSPGTPRCATRSSNGLLSRPSGAWARTCRRRAATFSM